MALDCVQNKTNQAPRFRYAIMGLIPPRCISRRYKYSGVPINTTFNSGRCKLVMHCWQRFARGGFVKELLALVLSWGPGAVACFEAIGSFRQDEGSPCKPKFIYGRARRPCVVGEPGLRHWIT